MNSFISFFKSTPALVMAIGFAILFEIGIRFIPNLHYVDGGGAFFTTYKRLIAEDPKKQFDILMYGDSRSLSINGKMEGDLSGFTMYNFSLPACGPRYFPFFLKKYLNNHSTPPKLVIYAADPEQFQVDKSFDPSNGFHFNSNKKIWAEYKHRLLNLFDFQESIEQYSGQEKFFIAREYIPYFLSSVRHKQGLESIITGFKIEKFSFENIYNVKINRLIESTVSPKNGQINLGNYFFSPDMEAMLKQGLEQSKDRLNHKRFYLKPLVDFLEFTKSKNIKTVLLNLPRASGLNQTEYFQAITPEIKSIVAGYPHAIYLEFPEKDYDPKLFSEGIHFNSTGEKKLNQEFDSVVFPAMVEFVGEKVNR